jgi:hypothetical protein
LIFDFDEIFHAASGIFTTDSGRPVGRRAGDGEAPVTNPHDRQGDWGTNGYTKFYAIYAPKGNVDQ